MYQPAMNHIARTIRLKTACLLGALAIASTMSAGAAGPPPCSSGSPSARGPEAVQTIRTTLAGVPAILRMPTTITKPPIVLWHGLGPPESEADLMEDLPLDGVPAVKVYLGLPLFGARAPIAESDSLVQRQAEDYALRIFEPVVAGAARELPAVLARCGHHKRTNRLTIRGGRPGASDQATLFRILPRCSGPWCCWAHWPSPLSCERTSRR